MGLAFQVVFCLFALQVLSCFPYVAATIGVVYSVDGDNLPLPSQAVQLLLDNGVTQVRIYDTSASILQAFSGTNIEVIVGIPNDQLATVGASNASALTWVAANIVPFSTVNITAIAVGNEVMTSFQDFTGSLVRTMLWVHDALIFYHLDSQIRVSTPVSTDILESSFPPSQSIFNQSLVVALEPLFQFLNLTDSYLMLNIHTYDVYQSNSQALTLKYALFEPVITTTDSYTNLHYSSLFDALLDACYAAMKALGFVNVRVVVTETGWPSQGGTNEIGASTANAETYNTNLVNHVYNNSGTPARPNIPITAFIYELFNEDLKSGPASERYYGLFDYNLSPVYNVDFTGQGRVLGGNSSRYQTWCVAKTNADPQALQQALDWACGQGGVNCVTTQQGGSCYLPDTVANHASWAFNAYYQSSGNAAGSCDFNGVAQIVSTDPSYTGCLFQSSNVTTTVNGTQAAPGGNSSHGFQLHPRVTTFSCLVTALVVGLAHLEG